MTGIKDALVMELLLEGPFADLDVTDLNVADKQALGKSNNFEFCLTWFTLSFEVWSIYLSGIFNISLYVEYLMLTRLTRLSYINFFCETY